MANLLGTLKVRLSVETEDFRKGLSGATQNLDKFSKNFQKFARSTLAQVASFTAVVAGIKKSIDAANELILAQNAVAASAKLAGQNVDDMRALVSQAEQSFGMGKIAANQFTLSISNLADKAGGLKDPAALMRAFLDLGASKGLTAAQSMEALNTAIRGSDEGMNAFFARKPIDLYTEFAKSIGKTAQQLTEQEKAQALVNEALSNGQSVRGEYAKWLQTVQGQQYQASQSMSDAATVIGQSFQPALVALVPAAHLAGDALAYIGLGITSLIADFRLLPEVIKASALLLASPSGAAKILDAATAKWDKTIADAKALMEQAGKIKPPPAIGGRGAQGAPGGAATGTKPFDPAKAMKDATLEDQMDRAKIQEQVNESRLSGETAIVNAMNLQINLADQLYGIQANAVLADNSMSKAQKDAELAKLEMVKERAQWEAKITAAAKEQIATGKAQVSAGKAAKDSLGKMISGDIGQLLSGSKISGSQIGSQLGTLASFIPGVGAIAKFLPGIGGLLGGLFGHKPKPEPPPAIVKGLDAIEKAQRDTITTIQAQTNALLNPDNRFFALPSTFTVPSYMPSLDSRAGSGGSVDNSTHITINIDGASGQDTDTIKDVAMQGLAEAIATQYRNGARNLLPQRA